MTTELLGANFQMANEKGDIIFEMKRKEPLGPDGKPAEMYYIFQSHKEHMTEEQAVEFDKVFKEKICVLARLMGFGMFDFLEISERAREQSMKMIKAGNIPGEEQVDITVEIFNYATGELTNLVIGISTQRAEGNEKVKK